MTYFAVAPHFCCIYQILYLGSEFMLYTVVQNRLQQDKKMGKKKININLHELYTTNKYGEKIETKRRG